MKLFRVTIESIHKQTSEILSSIEMSFETYAQAKQFELDMQTDQTVCTLQYNSLLNQTSPQSNSALH